MLQVGEVVPLACPGLRSNRLQEVTVAFIDPVEDDSNRGGTNCGASGDRKAESARCSEIVHSRGCYCQSRTDKDRSGFLYCGRRVPATTDRRRHCDWTGRKRRRRTLGGRAPRQGYKRHQWSARGRDFLWTYRTRGCAGRSCWRTTAHRLLFWDGRWLGDGQNSKIETTLTCGVLSFAETHGIQGHFTIDQSIWIDVTMGSSKSSGPSIDL